MLWGPDGWDDYLYWQQTETRILRQVNNLIADIAQRSVFAFGLMLLVVQLLAYELGNWLGRRRRAEGEVEGVGAVVGSMLALLAFVLALTLSFASTRFTERRAGTLAEANAIGTAWLRARAIGGPHGTEIARLLEEYTEIRMDFVRAGRNSPSIEQDNRQTNALQSKIWQHVAAIAQDESAKRAPRQEIHQLREQRLAKVHRRVLPDK